MTHHTSIHEIVHSKTTRTMSAEMDAWRARNMARMAALMPSPRPPRVPAVPDTREPLPCAFSDAELDVIWPKLQRVSPRMLSFDARFLRLSRNQLTARGKAIVHEIAHRYRGQIFGKDARKWHPAETVDELKKWASALLAPLFIPLKKEYFEEFERGEKTGEYRPYGKKWNEKTCRVFRRVILSCGYGKKRRLRGIITRFEKYNNPNLLAGWMDCYGRDNHEAAAIIGILVLGPERNGGNRE